MTHAELAKSSRQVERILEVAKNAETVFELTVYRDAVRKVAELVKAADLAAELEDKRTLFVATMVFVDAMFEQAEAGLLAIEGGSTPPGELLQ